MIGNDKQDYDHGRIILISSERHEAFSTGDRETGLICLSGMAKVVVYGQANTFDCYATNISEERCRRINRGYLDPASVKLEDWTGLESKGSAIIPRTGEKLYRIDNDSSQTN